MQSAASLSKPLTEIYFLYFPERFQFTEPHMKATILMDSKNKQTNKQTFFWLCWMLLVKFCKDRDTFIGKNRALSQQKAYFFIILILFCCYPEKHVILVNRRKNVFLAFYSFCFKKKSHECLYRHLICQLSFLTADTYFSDRDNHNPRPLEPTLAPVNWMLILFIFGVIYTQFPPCKWTGNRC